MAIGAALLMTGCGIPLTSDDLPPTRSQQTVGADTATPTAGTESAEASADAAPVFDDTCQPIPQELVEWIDTNSWEFSKTHPAGKGWMVSSGIGNRGFRYWVAVVPVKESAGYKSWSWAPRPDGSTFHVMPVPKNWDGSTGVIKNSTGAPWPAEAQKAAVACLSR